jgi:hypothetical protein
MGKRIALTIVVEIDEDADVGNFVQELDHTITHPDITVTDQELVDVNTEI